MSHEAVDEPSIEQGDEVHVIEDSAAEQQRKQELEERIRAHDEEFAARQRDGDDDPEGRSGGSARTMIAEAQRHVGYRESGNNDTKFNRWLGRIGGYPHNGYGYPWCHSFVSYCLGHSGNADAGPRTAGCRAGVSWFTSRGRWHSTPQAGDLVYYGANGATHVELVAAVSAGSIRTIGGNTSGSLGGHYFNGDGVYAKTVSRSSSKIAGYGRPAYGSGAGAVTPITSLRSVKQQQTAVNALGYKPALVVDNRWGPKTEAGVKWLQKKVGVAADGQWGKNTETKYVAYIKAH
jgi:hypothetical protein